MYKALLVDDERALLLGLLHSINWDELGFAGVDLAYDGSNAWKMLQSAPYDLVITDIRMPGMDGLELLSRIREQNDMVPVIVLTAYDEFDYVLRALRLGASNYLLKPLDPEDLRKSVIHAMEGKPAKNSEKPGSGTDAKEYFLHRWLTDGSGFRDLATRASLSGINVFLCSYNIVLLRLTSQQGDIPERILEALRRQCEVWALHERPDEYVFITGGRNTDAAELEKALESLEAEIRLQKARVVIGRNVQNYEEVSDSYRECLVAAMSRETADSDVLICAGQNEAMGWTGLLSPEEFEQRIQEKDRKGLEQEFGDWLEAVFRNDPKPRDALEEMKCMLEKRDTAGDTREMGKRFCLSRNAAEAGEILRKILDSILEEVKVTPIVVRAMDLIREEYFKPVTLAQIAERLGTNANYLGFLMHRECGVYFSDYLNRVRIREARRLLSRTNRNIARIAEDVGYSSANYFCQVFKKSTNLSPGQFREMHQER